MGLIRRDQTVYYAGGAQTRFCPQAGKVSLQCSHSIEMAKAQVTAMNFQPAFTKGLRGLISLRSLLWLQPESCLDAMDGHTPRESCLDRRRPGAGSATDLPWTLWDIVRMVESHQCQILEQNKLSTKSEDDLKGQRKNEL